MTVGELYFELLAFFVGSSGKKKSHHFPILCIIFLRIIQWRKENGVMMKGSLRPWVKKKLAEFCDEQKSIFSIM